MSEQRPRPRTLRLTRPVDRGVDPAHAPGKRKLGPVPGYGAPHAAQQHAPRHQRWVPTSGRVGRTRRSPHG